MELYLKNIGKVAEANVEIKGITVIAGENDTGKSTVGRALFSIFNGFYEIEEQIRQERFLSIVNVLENFYRYTYFLEAVQKDIEEYAEDILHRAEEYKEDPELLRNDMYAVFDLQAESAKTFLGRVDLDGSVRRICDKLMKYWFQLRLTRYKEQMNKEDD